MVRLSSYRVAGKWNQLQELGEDKRRERRKSSSSSRMTTTKTRMKQILQRFEVSKAVTLVLILGITIEAAFFATEYGFGLRNYGRNLSVSLSRLKSSYDYSCDQSVNALYVTVRNLGMKDVSDLSVTITNPLCFGSVSPLPSNLPPLGNLGFYVYSTKPNGTLTIGGNNTYVSVTF
jgi:hypothetical protein